MKNLKRSTIALSILIALLCTGCGEYITTTIYEIETKDGQTIKLACPVVDAGRSIFSYTIDSDCKVYK